jgi:hypothetical protein
MKRTAIVTAAALMFTGLTSLSFAADSVAPQGNQPAAVNGNSNGKSMVSPSPVGEKKNEVLPGKVQSVVPQKVEKIAQNNAPVTEKSISEKKEVSAPVAVKSGETEKKVEQKSQTAQPSTNPVK